MCEEYNAGVMCIIFEVLCLHFVEFVKRSTLTVVGDTDILHVRNYLCYY